MITISAYNWVPDFAKGFVRDLRVRWALEEAGLDYTVKLIDQDEKLTPAYRAWQPFCQVPAYRDDEVTLFESGAILLHVAQRSEALLPADPAERARAVAWVFAALNSIEIYVEPLAVIDLFHAGEDWAKQRCPQVEQAVRKRLADLAAALGDRPYLEGRFTVGDLMMATVLRILQDTDLVTSDPVLGPYLARCVGRPPFQKALAAQLTSLQAAPASAAAR